MLVGQVIGFANVGLQIVELNHLLAVLVCGVAGDGVFGFEIFSFARPQAVDVIGICVAAYLREIEKGIAIPCRFCSEQ